MSPSSSLRRHCTLFLTAVHYALIEHLRNRFAMVLIAVFIPVWSVLAFFCVSDTVAPFLLHATGQLLTPHGNQLTGISGALNAVTLIVGFMMFAVSFNGGPFDQRLALAGYPRAHLVLAKLTSLVLASAVVAAYATAATCAFWIPEQPALLAAALFGAGITYGALGVAFGSLLRREVEGMFAIVMTSIIDLALQNPLWSVSSNSGVVRYLPSYGAMQAATGAGFSSSPLPTYLLVQAGWFAGSAVIGFLTFHYRTRGAIRRKDSFPATRQRSPLHRSTPGRSLPPSRAEVPERGREGRARPLITDDS
ncbi:ABC transporter permease [Streptomyces sp. NPDC051243]|uniref:ABC transporter permease n=1 Tax=Streptomyces sp. NPDC051243 TaxID=3365646 RepID=UPI0037B10397